MPPIAPEKFKMAPQTAKKPFPWVWVIAGAGSVLIVLIFLCVAGYLVLQASRVDHQSEVISAIEATIGDEITKPESLNTPQAMPEEPVMEEPVAEEPVEEVVVVEPSQTPIPPTPTPLPTWTPLPTHTPTPLPSLTQTSIISSGVVNLAYVRGAVTDTDIYITSDTGSTFCVACNACDESDPNFSPDGRYIVYQSDCGGSYNIMRVSLSGGVAEQLTSTSTYDEREPDYSPDGNSIVYQRLPRNEGRFIPGEIWVMDSNGYDAVSMGFVGRAPVYSPDGRSIAYMSNISGRWQIYIYSLDTRNSQQLTSCVTNCRWPEWSPDGQYIAYNTTVSASNLDPSGIEYIPVSGGSATVLVRNEACGRPAWSASNWIAFNSPRGIERIHPDGSGRLLVIDMTDAWAPAYSR